MILLIPGFECFLSKRLKYHHRLKEILAFKYHLNRQHCF